MSLPPDEDPAGLVNREMRSVAERARTEGVHSIALAIDPRSWQLVVFTLWEYAPAAVTELCYEVLHVSSPSFHLLVDRALGQTRA
jgi:hypothetical protein